jgi:hypothetical protein
MAEERVGRKCGSLRVLNSYWVNQVRLRVCMCARAGLLVHCELVSCRPDCQACLQQNCSGGKGCFVPLCWLAGCTDHV